MSLQQALKLPADFAVHSRQDAIQELDHDLQRIGVGCYPEGHPNIADDALVDALQRKQPYADYMVSQLCFDAAAFTR